MMHTPSKSYRLHYVDMDWEIRRQRVRQRNKQQGEFYTFSVTDGMLDFVEDLHEPPDVKEPQNITIVTDQDESEH